VKLLSSLLPTAIVAMQVVKEDCSCIIAVGALLTRRTVGVLYILCCCFSQVSQHIVIIVVCSHENVVDIILYIS